MNVKDSKRCPVVGTSALQYQGVRYGKIISFNDIKRSAERGSETMQPDHRHQGSSALPSYSAEPTVGHTAKSVVDDLLDTTVLGCSDAVCSIAYEDARGVSFGLLTKGQSLVLGAGLVLLASLGMFLGA